MKEKVCGVTGHREIPAEYMEQAEQGLRREIEKAIADGYTYFISGFADGADQLFARIVLEKAKENPALRLEAAIPFSAGTVPYFTGSFSASSETSTAATGTAKSFILGIKISSQNSPKPPAPTKINFRCFMSVHSSIF